MEVKDFKDYSKEEQKILLLQWFHNYGKNVYSSSELLSFLCYIEEEPMHAFNIAFGLKMSNKSSKDLCTMMRRDTLSLYSLSVRAFSKSSEYAELYAQYGKKFISELVNGYLHPEKGAKSTVDDVLKALDKIERRKEDKFINMSGISEEKVTSLYKRCLLNEDDFDGDDLKENFAVGEGINFTSVFSVDRLNKYRNKISECISMLPRKIEEGISFSKLTRDKCSYAWTQEKDVADMLVQMGMATNMLYFPAPREDWEYLPGKVGYVAVNQEYDKASMITGNTPQEYTKTIDGICKR